MRSIHQSQKTIKKILALVYISLALTACQIDIEKELDKTQTLELIIPRHEKSTQSRLLTTQDPQYIVLKRWTANNKHGWHKSEASYLPNVVVKGKGISINFINNLAIVNYGEKQYVKEISLNDYKYLTE